MKPTVLLIEDNKVFRELLTTILSADGWHVETATDGDAGHQKWMTGPWDLVVTDYDMPGKTGVELTAQFHAMEPRQKIFMISGSPWMQGEFLRAGGAAFFEKMDTTAWKAALKAFRVAFESEHCDCADCADEACRRDCDPESGLCRGCAEAHDAEAEQRWQADVAQGKTGSGDPR